MNPTVHIVLVEPLIPQNTGNVGRLAAATGSALHLVHPLGFEVSEARVRRAGLDYWPWIDLSEHESFEALYESQRVATPEAQWFFFSKSARPCYTEARYRPGDFLVFGQETGGLPQPLRERFAGRLYRIPILNPNVRSLNLANAAAVVVYEALRQMG